MKKSELRNLNRRIGGVTMPINRKRAKWGRNFPCLCGSEKKYKHCCMKEIDSLTGSDGNMAVAEIPADMQRMIKEYHEAKERETKELAGQDKKGANEDG